MKKINLKIEGMHCSSCAMSIDFDLEELEGIKFSKTSYAKQECEIEFDSAKASEKKILETLEKIGYKGSLN